jgi:hypothetical protein
MDVLSVSKANSIFTLWVEDPAFSNANGTISFNGGLPTPGYTGTRGETIKIVFRIKKAGDASLYFSSAAVRANDGMGTDVLSTKADASFSFVAVKQETETKESTPEIQQTTPASKDGIRISSPTHPDENAWYNSKNVTFTWNSTGLSAVRLSYNKSPHSDPGVEYSPAIGEKNLEITNDGIYYFHAKGKNTSGWGPISDYRFQIDTEVPQKFETHILERGDLTDPIIHISVKAEDSLSGIDHYTFQFNSNNPLTWRDEGSGIYKTQVLSHGHYNVTAKAYDKAGNAKTNTFEFDISPIPSPLITEYKESLTNNDTLVIKGESAPGTNVTIWLQKEGEEAVATQIDTKKNGEFSFIKEENESGTYTAWAESRNEKGATSEPSRKINFIIEKTAILRTGEQISTILSIFVPIIALIIVCIFMIWYARYKTREIKKKVRRQSRQAEKTLHEAIKKMRGSIEDQIQVLNKAQNKRDLTKEEIQIQKKLQKSLDELERTISDELEEIEKDSE